MKIINMNNRNTIKGIFVYFSERKDIARQKNIAERRLLERAVPASSLFKDENSSKILNPLNGDLFTGKIIETDYTYSNGNQYLLGVKKGVLSSILLRNLKKEKIKLETLNGDKYFKSMTPDDNQDFYDDVLKILGKIKTISKDKRMKIRLNSRTTPYEDIVFSYDKLIYKKSRIPVSGKIVYKDKNLDFYYLVKDGHVKAQVIKDKISAKTVMVKKSSNW